MSRISADVAEEIRRTVSGALVEDGETGMEVLDGGLASSTFVLPDTSQYTASFREFIRTDFLQTEHLMDLTTGANPVINWSPELAHLTPIQTTGDGNCLLNGISLCMFGVHDRDLSLRTALRNALTRPSPGLERLRQRWAATHVREGATAAQLEQAWEAVVAQSSLQPVPNEFQRVRYEYLEAFHVFVLANLIRRPILVFAEPHIRDPLSGQVVVFLDDADRMDGLYLPLLHAPSSCSRNPLALTFSDAHFAALVAQQPPRSSSSDARQDSSTALLQLQSRSGDLLPIHYLTAEERARGDAFLAPWLDLRTTPSGYRCALQSAGPTLAVISELLARYFEFAREKSEQIARLDTSAAASGPCKGNCGFAGSQAFEGFCSQCFRTQSGLPINSSHIPAFRDSEEPPTGPCRGPGCCFTGARDRLFYCSVCFAKYTKGEFDSRSSASAPAPPISTQPSPFLPEVLVKCTGGCGFYGAAVNLGYCSLCFQKYILSHISQR